MEEKYFEKSNCFRGESAVMGDVPAEIVVSGCGTQSANGSRYPREWIRQNSFFNPTLILLHVKLPES